MDDDFMVNDNTEIELKYALAYDIDCSEIKNALDKVGKVGNISSDNLSNVYFDTKDFDLARNKIGLRIRKANSYTEMTMKIAKKSSSSLHQRKEYNIPLDSDRYEPNFSLLPFDVQMYLSNLNLMDKDLYKINHIDFKRDYFLLEIDGNQFEIAKDLGFINTEQGRLAINELEIEVKQFSGDVKSLYQGLRKIVSALCKANIPLSLDPYSKHLKSHYFSEFMTLKNEHNILLSQNSHIQYDQVQKDSLKMRLMILFDRSTRLINHISEVKQAKSNKIDLFAKLVYDFENLLGLYRITHYHFHLNMIHLALTNLIYLFDNFIDYVREHAKDDISDNINDLKEAKSNLEKLNEYLDNKTYIANIEFDIEEDFKLFFAETAKTNIADVSLTIKSAIIYFDL